MQEANDWFHSFFTNSVDAFLEFDHQRRYLSINPVAAAWLQLKPDEIVGKTHQELLQVYPDRAPIQHLIFQIDPCLQQVLRSGEKKIAIHEILTSDGGIKVYETAYTPIADSTGTTLRVFAVGRDITSHYRWQQQKSQQLLRSNHLLWLNTANTPLAMIGWDEEFRIIQWSKRAEEIFGWTAPEAMGKTFRDFPLIYEQDAEAVHRLIPQLLAGESNTSINRNYTKNGQVIWCHWFNSFIRSGDCFTILSLVEDITDRQELEAAAAERARLTTLVADVSIALTRHPKDILHPCCEAIVQRLEATAAKIWTFNPQENALELQATVGIFPATEDSDRHISVGQGKIGLIAEKKQPDFDGGWAVADWELASENWGNFPIPNHPSSNQVFAFAGYPLIVEERLVGVLAILSQEPFTNACLQSLTSVADVIALGIERKRAEAELKSARAFLNSVVENLPVGVFAKDAESLKFVLWNKAGEAIAGFTSQEIVGKSDYDLFPKEQADVITAQERQVLSSSQSPHLIKEILEEPTQTRHKGIRILHTRKIPVFDAQGNPEYLLGITEDITERKQVDDSIRLYGQIVENMQIGLYVYHLEDINDDRTLRAIASNPASTEFTGVEMADVLGITLDEIFPDQRSKGIPQVFATVVREQKAVELEDIDYAENGSILRAFSVKAFPLPNNCVGVAFENITDRKQLELELQQALQQSERSQQLLRTVIDATPDWIFAKDRNFRYILVNQSDAEGMGREVEEILGKDDVELGFPLEEVFGNPHHNIRGFRADDIAALAGEVVHNSYDLVTFADGTRHIFDTQKIPLRDAEGEIFAVLGFAHDITERHLAQEALRQKTSELEAVFQALPDLYFRLTADGTILDCLSGNSRDIELPSTAFLGKKMAEILPPAISQRFERAIQETLALQGQVLKDLVTLEYSLPTPQGEQTYEARLLPCSEVQIIMIVRNITERKQAEAQLKEKNHQLEQTLQKLRNTQAQLIQAEKMSSLGQLVAGIAHEINNPVSFIYGNIVHANTYAKNLLRLCILYQKYYPEPGAEISEILEEIDLEFMISDFPYLLNSMNMGAERIREIVLSLRNFARIEEAGLKTVDIHQGIDSTLLILQHRLKENNQHNTIEIVKNYGNLPLIQCYPGLLNQVFINILNNAIDALTESKGQIEAGGVVELEKEGSSSLPLACERLPSIHIRTVVLKDNRISLTISDNGPGMQESVKSRVFDPFFTTKPVGKGTGLGLSISYQIVVEKHGGVLRCISTPGGGAEFVIEIPVRQTEN